ncbi:MAG: hypothetical protein K8I02_09430, partial [Candidatus Methylomirabilis sp.]|nr:hypothetical protein [Deltaproteobacteria bacterium]
CNLMLWMWTEVRAGEFTARTVRNAVGVQLLVDVASLTLLLHMAGGVENPFVLFFAFHMAIGAMFLPRRELAVVVLSAFTLLAMMAIGEAAGAIAHVPLRFPGMESPSPLYREPVFVAGYLTAVAAMLGCVAYFVRTVVDRRYRAEMLRREHERVALSRTRLAKVGELSAGVAHSIRNPVHGLLNCVAILRGRAGGADPEEQEIIAFMEEGLRRIEGVTRRLLSLTREEPVQPVPTDLRAFVEDNVRFVAARAGARDVKVRTELPADTTVLLDSDRMGEALLNVLDNAIDACSDGGEVAVRAMRLPCAGESGVCIEVVDTGEGIAPERRDRIFDAFYTTKPVGEGTGLGLAVTRRGEATDGPAFRLRARSRPGPRPRAPPPRAAEPEFAP